MIVVETILADIAVIGDFVVERIDFRTASNVAGHFGKGALVGDFDDGDAARLENTIEFGHGLIHMFKVMGDANHHEAIELVILEW